MNLNEENLTKETMNESSVARQMLLMHPTDAIGAAWEYFYKTPWHWVGDSHLLNIKSTIDIYDDIYDYNLDKEIENGTLLHFNQELYILGSVKDLGDHPIFYHGSFEINNHDFELCFKELNNDKIVFKPKKECAHDYVAPPRPQIDLSKLTALGLTGRV